MAIFIGHRTALAYWRTHDRNWAQPISRAAPQENNSPYYAQMDTGILWKFGIDEKPVSILVSCKANMRKSQNLSPRIWSGKHPSRSFYKIAQDLYISTPEATFLQLGKELSLIQLITVGYELCGSYGLSVQSSSGFLRREPRSNPQFIERYLEKCEGIHGVKAAKRASSYLIKGSASPMESLLSMLLCLPPSLGDLACPARSLTTLLRPTREASRYVDVIYAGPSSSSHSNTTATPSIRTQASFTLIQAEDRLWRRQGFMLSPSQKTRFSTEANCLTLQQ